MQRLNTMVSSLVLRRTKEEMTVLKLTRRIVEVHSLQLPQEQQEVYDVIFHWARSHAHAHTYHDVIFHWARSHAHAHTYHNVIVGNDCEVSHLNAYTCKSFKFVPVNVCLCM